MCEYARVLKHCACDGPNSNHPRTTPTHNPLPSMNNFFANFDVVIASPENFGDPSQRFGARLKVGAV
jgi:hypothetical protein